MIKSETETKVLVTGAGGFIGSHLTEELVKRGFNVTCFLRYKSSKSRGSLKNIKQEYQDRIRYIYGDLKDYEALNRALEGISIVFHLASISSVVFSFENPGEVFDSNTNGTLNLLLAAKNNGVKKTVIASTASIYGPPQTLPVSEKHRINPRTPYAASKLAAEEIAMSFFYSFNMPVTVLRLFNTFGAGQTMRALIPTIILQAIHSSKIKIGKTDSVRDFNHVSNAVNAFMLAAEETGSNGEIFNIGSGSKRSIAEIIDLTGRILDKKLVTHVEDIRKRPEKSDADILWSDISKAKEKIRYKPQITFEEGFKRTVNFYREHGDSYFSGKYQI